MVHQEDAGLNVEMAKLAFAKGIWSYVRKMSDALREYSTTNQLQLNSAVSAITSIPKVRIILCMITLIQVSNVNMIVMGVLCQWFLSQD